MTGVLKEAAGKGNGLSKSTAHPGVQGGEGPVVGGAKARELSMYARDGDGGLRLHAVGNLAPSGHPH